MAEALRSIDEGLWVREAPVRFMGLNMGTRMTVVRLSGGGLLLHSPTPFDEPVGTALAELGPVQVLVAPNCFHHLSVGPWLQAYPDAVCWAAPGLRKKRPDLRIDHAFREDTPPWSSDLEVIPIPKTPAWEETIFWHPATRTIIAADILQNFREPWTGLWPRIYGALSGVGVGPSLSRAIRLGMRDRAALRAIIDDLIAREPRRLIVAHGDIVEDDPAGALRTAYAWLKG